MLRRLHVWRFAMLDKLRGQFQWSRENAFVIVVEAIVIEIPVRVRTKEKCDPAAITSVLFKSSKLVVRKPRDVEQANRGLLVKAFRVGQKAGPLNMRLPTRSSGSSG